MAAEALLDELTDPTCFGPAVRAVQLIQTHLSVVCVTDELVFKLKKAITLPFVDFAPLPHRRRACRDEVRLNRRLCPDVYLGTAALRRVDGKLRFAAIGDDHDDADLDVAVVMRRLPQERMLDVLVANGDVDADELRRLARVVATFHADAARGPEVTAHGSPERLAEFARANFDELHDAASDDLSRPLLDATRHASARAFARHLPLLRARAAGGRVVDGHGDLHARNVCMTTPPTIYDCIEFEPALRCGDVATEVAFLVMDLRYRGADTLARAFVQSYLQASGDRELATLLPTISSYRAMVRGKISAMAAGEPELSDAERQHARRSTRAHLQLAAGCLLEDDRPRWIVVCGPPASGKSVLARTLARACQWPHLATDVERKRLAGLQPSERASAEHYTAAFSERTYRQVLARAADATDDGHRAVLLDGNFATRAQRAAATAAAARSGATVTFAYVQVDAQTAAARAQRRAQTEHDASDADAEVTRRRHQSFVPPGADEGALLHLDGTHPCEALADEALAGLLRAAYADSGADARSDRS